MNSIIIYLHSFKKIILSFYYYDSFVISCCVAFSF